MNIVIGLVNDAKLQARSYAVNTKFRLGSET
jgi:hypothetical protein